VLSILSGKGPDRPESGGPAKEEAAGTGSPVSAIWTRAWETSEGLTKMTGPRRAISTRTAPPRRTKGEDVAGHLRNRHGEGFENAKSSALSKIAVAEAEKPEAMDRSRPKFTAIAAPPRGHFINKKQSMGALLYEKTQSNPAWRAR